METLAQDVRYAFRSLARRPGFAAVVVLTLALGFGANAALFSVARAVLLRRLPFAEPGELVQVWERHDERGRSANVVSPANFTDWRRRARSFADLAGYWRQSISLTGIGEPEEVQLTIASPGLFRLLGVPAVAGRLLADDDVAAGQLTGDAAVISHDYWSRRFGGDPGAVGRSVTLGTSSVTIVGVAPPALGLVEPATDVWMPTTFEWADRVSQGRFISVVGRRAGGVTLDQARAEMDAIARRLAEAHPEFNTGWGVSLVPLSEQLVGDVRPALLLLLGAVGLLLLIACANVANLMLARAAAREREIAIRAALGADGGRICRQLLTESALLAAAAGLGLLLAALGSRGLLALLPADLWIPRLADARPDASVAACGSSAPFRCSP